MSRRQSKRCRGKIKCIVKGTEGSSKIKWWWYVKNKDKNME
jgi:hypothetical protein